MRGAWSQFQGDGGNTGFKWRATAWARRPAWTFASDSSLTGSPVVDSDGVVYLTTFDGQLIAVQPDGRERWRRGFQQPIVAAPAVAEDRTIHFLRQAERDEDASDRYPLQTTVTKLANSGRHLWSVELPDEGFATNAPKVWQRPDGAHVVVAFVRRTPGGPASEVMVLGPDGRVRARSGPLGCPWPVTAGVDVGAFIRKVGRGIKAVYKAIRPWGHEFDTSGINPFPYVIHPTPAVTDAGNVVASGSLLIAVADHLCSVTVLRYSGASLQPVWRVQNPLELVQSSPLITPFGQLVIGDENGRVRAFAVDTGDLLWTYDAGEPVLGASASLNQPIYVPTRRHVHVLNSVNGREIAKLRVRFDRNIEATPLSSPAVSTSHVHMPARQGLTSFPVGEWNRRAHDIEYRQGFLTPSPAIGPAGELYVVHASRELWAYPAP